MFKKKSLSYLEFNFSIAILLSLVTLIVSLTAPSMTLRLFSVFVYYFFFNILVLVGVAFFPSIISKKSKLGADLFFLYPTGFYVLFYILSSLNFVFTGQVIKVQSILFILKINPLSLSFLLIIGYLLFVALLAFVTHKIVEFKKFNKRDKSLLINTLVTVIIIFLIFIALVYPRLDVENDLVKRYSQGNKIYLTVDRPMGEKLLSPKINFTNFNVVFILLESLSTERLSYYGYERNVTPNIDSLAKQSKVFLNAYTTATHSDYAQPAYLSSNYILENNYRNFFPIQKNQNAVWQIFKRQGYKTFYFSSQDDRWAGMDNYFNYSSLDYYWYSLSDNQTDYGKGLGKKDYDGKTITQALKNLNDSFIVCSIENNSNSTNCTFERTIPFFLYLNFQATHDPLSYPEEYAYYLPDESDLFESSEDKLISNVNRYDNALRYVDLQVGKILDYLKKTNQQDNTIIILASDHGHDLYSKHNSYGHGLTIYEDEIRTPLIFYLPGESHSEIKERVSHIDVLPTVMDLMGIEPPEGFRGSPFSYNRRIFLYAQNHKYLGGMIEKDIKVIIDFNRRLAEVYNLNEDPNELNNLLDEGNWDKEILTLLMWHDCQLNYFSVEEKPIRLEKYCEVFRN
jgi:arylsulfatase A-like enzyme